MAVTRRAALAGRCLGATLVMLAFMLGACGGSASAPAPTESAEKPPPPKPITLELTKLSKETTDETIEVRGVVTENAEVTVNGKHAKVKGERFRASLALDLGKNEVRVRATKPGFESGRETAEIRRDEPPLVAETSPVAPSAPEVPPNGSDEDIAPDCPAGQVFYQGACRPEPPGYSPGNLLPGESDPGEAICGGPETEAEKRELAEQAGIPFPCGE